MTERNHKYLVIDLQKCDQCQACSIDCGQHEDLPDGKKPGLSGLRERATFALVCRRCSSASCVMACVFDALERGSDGVIKRHDMRCVSCKMCAHACPFGTIYTDMLSFYQASCDQCLERIGTQPVCVASCPNGALEYRVMDPAETDVHIVNGYLAARAERWERREASA